MCIDVHLQNGDVGIYRLWLFIYVNAVSVVVVIGAVCDMPGLEFSLCERVYIHNTYSICNFSNFVSLCTDDTDTPFSCDKRFRDFLGVCFNLSSISSTVSYVRIWHRQLTFLFFTEPVSLNFLACLLIVLGIGTGRPGTLLEFCVVFQNMTFCFWYTCCGYTHVHTMRVPVWACHGSQ